MVNISKEKLYPLFTEDLSGQRNLTTWNETVPQEWFYAIVKGKITDAKYWNNGIGQNDVVIIYDNYFEAKAKLDKINSWDHYITAGWLVSH